MGFHTIEVVNVGGDAGNGSNAGLFYLNANNDSSNDNRNIGTQLVCLSVSLCELLTSWSNMLPQELSRVTEQLGGADTI